jgi:uncharacterized protein
MKKIESALLEKAIQRLVSALHPERIYLYGSHAYGQPHENSDIDLLIVVDQPDLSIYDMTVEGYRALRGLFFPAEINVVTQSEFNERSHWFSSIESTVSKKGQILYESDKK